MIPQLLSVDIRTHDDTIYSIRVDDINKLNSAIQSDLAGIRNPDLEKKRRKLNRNLQFFYEKDKTYELTFLEKFKDYGITLYKANDTGLTNWNQLELGKDNNNNNKVIETPCNNN